MLWIHGGSNVVGSGSFYDGGRLAATHGVVVAALNYRLGPLGFFRHPALRAEGGGAQDHSGNFGLLDQIRALQWLRENVAAFGGDPGNVTIFGESAGGRDVLALLVSPPARGLFQRAIVQSGGTVTLEPARGEALADAAPPGEPNSSGEVLLRLFEADGAKGRAGALAQLAAMTPREVADYLRGKSGPELLGAYEVDRYESMPEVPQMFGDGSVLPAGQLAELMAAGSAAAVPVVLGTTRDEFRVFLFANPNYSRYLLGLLPMLRDEERFLVTAEHMSNWWKATAADELAAAQVRSGNSDVFVYRFDWDEEPRILTADLSVIIGASHGFEIPFVFGHWDLGKAANVVFSEDNLAGREELARAMMSYWVGFARTGDPGRGASGDLPEWRAWDNRPTAEKFLRLDTEAGGGIQMVGGSVTREGVLRSIENDARLPERRHKCRVYWELAKWGRSFEAADYERAGCADYPLDTFPD
jgi:para-nitrobenzyl esterase